jgi:hypothetical protein
LRRDDVTTIVLRDEDGICCNRPGRNVDPSQRFLWPVNDQLVGGEDAPTDHFYSMIFGKLSIDDGDEQPGEALPVTFGMFASDGAQLHIRGVNFSDASPLVDLSILIDDDRTMSFPQITSNTNAFGLAELTEGVVYDFEAFHFDDRTDAGFELWTAIGEHLDGFDSQLFFPLSSVLDQMVLPRNVGLTFVQPAAIVAGDYNGNDQLDVGDAQLLINAVRSSDLSFDVNLDGEVDQVDLQSWIHDLKGTWIGDANLDGLFNSTDLVEVMVWGKYERDLSASWAEGDWNADGRFSTSDLVAALQDGGYETTRAAGTAVVPEPSTLLIGLLCAFPLWRRHPAAIQ